MCHLPLPLSRTWSGAEKVIDRQMLPSRQHPCPEAQHSPFDRHHRTGRYHIDMIRLYRAAVADFRYRNLGGARQDLSQFAGIFRSKVLHQHKCHACFHGKRA